MRPVLSLQPDGFLSTYRPPMLFPQQQRISSSPSRIAHASSACKAAVCCIKEVPVAALKKRLLSWQPEGWQPAIHLPGLVLQQQLQRLAGLQPVCCALGGLAAGLSQQPGPNLG